MSVANGKVLKSTALLLVMVLFFLPLLNDIALAQNQTPASDFLQGKMDGEYDAKASGAWFFAGFCLGLIGVLIAYLVKPTPSTASLVGKSQEYITGYVEGYKDKGAKLQGQKALYGLGTLCLLDVVLYAVLIAASTDTE